MVVVNSLSLNVFYFSFFFIFLGEKISLSRSKMVLTIFPMYAKFDLSQFDWLTHVNRKGLTNLN